MCTKIKYTSCLISLCLSLAVQAEDFLGDGRLFFSSQQRHQQQLPNERQAIPNPAPRPAILAPKKPPANAARLYASIQIEQADIVKIGRGDWEKLRVGQLRKHGEITENSEASLSVQVAP